MITELLKKSIGALIANWQGITTAAGVVAAIILGIWLVITGWKNKKNRNIFWGCGILSVTVFVTIAAFSSDLGNALLAVATLILALFTGFLVLENRALREQDRNKEKRDRKERLLNEILYWGIDVAGCGWDVKAPIEFAENLHTATGDKVKLEALRQVYFSNLQQRFKLTKARSEYIYSISLSISNDALETKQLTDSIKDIDKQLEAVIFAIEKRLSNPNNDALSMKFKKLSDDSKEAARNLSKYIGSLKCKDLR